MSTPAASAAANASTPLKRFAYASTTTCAAQASEYGKCILATYTDVRKDACKAEFERFGACLRSVVRAFLVFGCRTELTDKMVLAVEEEVVMDS